MLSLDTIIEDSIMLFDYCTKIQGYNMFIIDEVDSEKVKLLRKYIDSQDKVMCAKYYMMISDEIDELRNKYC